VLGDLRDDPLFDLAADFRIAFVVDPRHLLIPVGHHAHLRRRGTAAVANERRRDARLPARLGKCRRAIVASGDSDQRRLSAERHDVACHVRGAADPVHVVVECHDRNRRLRRDACHATDDELVDHGVADDEDVHAAHARDDLARALRREWR